MAGLGHKTKPDRIYGGLGTMASGGASGSSGVSDVERMMEELGLKEEDLDDVLFDEQQAPPEEPRWNAIAKVNH